MRTKTLEEFKQELYPYWSVDNLDQMAQVAYDIYAKSQAELDQSLFDNDKKVREKLEAQMQTAEEFFHLIGNVDEIDAVETAEFHLGFIRGIEKAIKILEEK